MNTILENVKVLGCIIDKNTKILTSMIERYIIDVFKRHGKIFYNIYMHSPHGCPLNSIGLRHLRLVNNNNTKFTDKIFLYGEYGRGIETLPVKDQMIFFEFFVNEIEPKIANLGS